MMLNLAADFEPALLSDDPRAIANRDAIDFSQKISYEDALAGRNKRPIRVFADGVYDMLHEGHARQLYQAKTRFPGPVYVLVGIPNDAETIAQKGIVVMNQNERAEMIRHCRYVDEVIMSSPYLIDATFVAEHKIDFVAHDDLPYKQGDTDDIYKWMKDAGIFLPTYRTEGISTSDIITRIIKTNRPENTLPDSCLQWLKSATFTAWQNILRTLF